MDVKNLRPSTQDYGSAWHEAVVIFARVPVAVYDGDNRCSHMTQCDMVWCAACETQPARGCRCRGGRGFRLVAPGDPQPSAALFSNTGCLASITSILARALRITEGGHDEGGPRSVHLGMGGCGNNAGGWTVLMLFSTRRRGASSWQSQRRTVDSGSRRSAVQGFVEHSTYLDCV